MNLKDTLNSRPNFFPGQMVDYRDFNRLGEYPQRALSDLMRAVYPGGGIFFGVRNQFATEPLDSLQVRVRPGVAVLADGQLSELQQDVVVDLSKFAKASAVCVYVRISNRQVACDRMTDPDDTSISGYLSEASVATVEASLEASSGPMGLELFRAEVSSGGIKINTSHRRILLAQSAPDFSELHRVQTLLYSIEESLRKLGKVFLIQEGVAHASHLLSSLHSEVLSLPQQPMKTGFLLSEFSRKAALFFESLDRQLPLSRTDLDRARLLKLLNLLEPLQVFEPMRATLPIEGISEVATMMAAIVRFAEERFSLFTVVEEAIAALRDQPLRAQNEISLAGQIFKRVDSIEPQTVGRIRYQSREVQTRRMQAKFANGDAAEAHGAFFRDGSTDIEFEVSRTDRPAVVFLKQYVRRPQGCVHYDVNGKTLSSDNWETLRLSNQWMNRGLVVPSDRLVPGLNRLSMRVEKSESDFGFFDMHVYQPGDLGGN
jgi:hypothetical protein